MNIFSLARWHAPLTIFIMASGLAVTGTLSAQAENGVHHNGSMVDSGGRAAATQAENGAFHNGSMVDSEGRASSSNLSPILSQIVTNELASTEAASIPESHPRWAYLPFLGGLAALGWHRKKEKERS